MKQKKNLESIVLKRKMKKHSLNLLKKLVIGTSMVFAPFSYHTVTYLKTNSEIKNFKKASHQIEYSKYIVDTYNNSEITGKIMMYGGYSAAIEYIKDDSYSK
ncbi:MAG TPA: hypothetical protein V6C58_15855 [Allocoleopsis sp.]